MSRMSSHCTNGTRIIAAISVALSLVVTASCSEDGTAFAPTLPDVTRSDGDAEASRPIAAADVPAEVLVSIEDSSTDIDADAAVDTSQTIVEHRDIYDSETDSYTSWPYTGPLAEECWRQTPEIANEDIGINSWMAVDGDVIYYETASRQQDAARSFLHAMSSSGEPIWHAETAEMMQTLPPIVDDDGNILLIAQAISRPSLSPNGLRVQKWSKRGTKLWDGNGDAVTTDLVYTYDRQLGSVAGAIDDEGNLYFVTGSRLRSLDGETGAFRWEKNVVPDGELNTGRWPTTPTVVDNRVYIVDDSMNLLVLDPRDGSVVIKRAGLFAGIDTTLTAASRAGFLVAPAYAYGMVTYTLDGEILALVDEGFGESAETMIGTDDDGVVYAKNLIGNGMRAMRSDLSEIWRSTDWLSFPDTRFIIDEDGHVALKSRYDMKFSVLDQTTGKLLFDEHPFVVTYGQPVVARPGEVIIAGRFPMASDPHLKCIKVPGLGVPDPSAWSTGHGNFKNQRRLHTFAWPADPPDERDGGGFWPAKSAD